MTDAEGFALDAARMLVTAMEGVRLPFKGVAWERLLVLRNALHQLDTVAARVPGCFYWLCTECGERGHSRRLPRLCPVPGCRGVPVDTRTVAGQSDASPPSAAATADPRLLKSEPNSEARPPEEAARGAGERVAMTPRFPRQGPPDRNGHEWITTSDPMTPMCRICEVRDGDPEADAPCRCPADEGGKRG